MRRKGGDGLSTYGVCGTKEVHTANRPHYGIEDVWRRLKEFGCIQVIFLTRAIFNASQTRLVNSNSSFYLHYSFIVPSITTMKFFKRQQGENTNVAQRRIELSSGISK